jgi:hypothetical protein
MEKNTVKYTIKFRHKKNGKVGTTICYLSGATIEDVMKQINNTGWISKVFLIDAIKSGQWNIYLSRPLSYPTTDEETLLDVKLVETGIEARLVDGKFTQVD